MSAQPLLNNAMTFDVPPVGTVLAGSYRVEGVLATGGMGIVLRATELASERAVAIKVMTAGAAADPEQVARFRREAKAASSLTSTHVVRVLDFGELETGLPYLVMEHLEGTSLADLVKARGALPIGEAVELVLQAIHGVAQAHALGIVHRDLKPANLFVTGDAPAHVVKVLDFGASKLTAESTVDPSDPGGVTVASSLIGSPRYMAPEQIRSALEVDARADIYALGATLHELLSGKPIFFADSLARIFAQVLWDAPEPLSASRDDVPAALEAVVARCLAKLPADRYATVEALAAALAPFGSAATAGDHPVAPPAPPRPKRAPAPSPTSGSKLVAARLFKPDADPDEPKPAKAHVAISASRAAVVLKSTAKMARVRMASEAPKRTVKIAAFALAARLAPSVVAVPSPAADAVARAARTAKMARFAPAAPPPAPAAAAGPSVARAALADRSRAVIVLACLALLLVAAIVAVGFARHRAHARSGGSQPATARAVVTK
jgi:serine/threonine protein kinase